MCVAGAAAESLAVGPLSQKCDLRWSRSRQGIWKTVCRWERAETPNHHSASVASCERTSRVGQRKSRASSSSLFTYIFIQKFRYHMHTLPRSQTKWAQKLKRPSLVKQYEVPFLWDGTSLFFRQRKSPPSLINPRIFTVHRAVIFSLSFEAVVHNSNRDGEWRFEISGLKQGK